MIYDVKVLANMFYFIFLSFSNPDEKDTSSLDQMGEIIQKAVLKPLPAGPNGPDSADWQGDRDNKSEEDSTKKMFNIFNRAVK